MRFKECSAGTVNLGVIIHSIRAMRLDEITRTVNVVETDKRKD